MSRCRALVNIFNHISTIKLTERENFAIFFYLFDLLLKKKQLVFSLEQLKLCFIALILTGVIVHVLNQVKKVTFLASLNISLY